MASGQKGTTRDEGRLPVRHRRDDRKTDTEELASLPGIIALGERIIAKLRRKMSGIRASSSPKKDVKSRRQGKQDVVEEAYENANLLSRVKPMPQPSTHSPKANANSRTLKPCYSQCMNKRMRRRVTIRSIRSFVLLPAVPRLRFLPAIVALMYSALLTLARAQEVDLSKLSNAELVANASRIKSHW